MKKKGGRRREETGRGEEIGRGEETGRGDKRDFLNFMKTCPNMWSPPQQINGKVGGEGAEQSIFG